MPTDYVVWRWDPGEHDAVFRAVSGTDNEAFAVDSGNRLAGKFPSGAKLAMNKDYPTNTLLTDSPQNMNRFVLASAPLKEFLEGRKLKAVEFIPITLVNHKSRPVGKKYFIVNPYDWVDCLDAAKSGARIDTDLIPGDIERVKKLVLVPSRVDKERELFRIKDLRQVVLASRKLADAIDKEGFTGIRWLALDEFSTE